MKKVSKEPLISVIVPVYKVEEYLDRCVDSIINQTYKNLEILLVDDGSPDNCPKMCDDYAKKDKRIKVIHKKNGGLSDARNVGIDNSKGDYLTFIDSDDYVELNYVEFLYNLIVKYDADISMGKQYVRYSNKVINTGSGYLYDNLSKEEIFEKLMYGEDFDVSAWAKLYKKELFIDIKYPVNRLFEDSATTYKLMDKANKIVMKSEPIYNYIIRENSITNCIFNVKKMDLITSTIEMTDFIAKKYKKLKKSCDRRLMYAYLSTYTQYIKSKHTNIKIEKELLSYIQSNRKKILKDRRISKRDRIGLYCTYLGKKIYGISWLLYEKIRN